MSDPIRLLCTGRLPPALRQRLAECYVLEELPAPPDQAAFLAAHARVFAGLVTNAGQGADAALIDALPNLRVISSFGVGLDKIDLAAAARRGIVVGYTPDVLNDCVADLAFGLVIDVMRGLSASDRFVRRGEWAAGGHRPLQHKVSGRRLGIVGFGRIGQTIARRASGFDMAVRYHTRRPVAGAEQAHEPDLIELARWCDCLVVIVAGGAGTRHLVDRAVLDALGPAGFLVNVARGSVIDEAALVEALRERRIAGAGLDVYAAEPRVPTELFTLDNVVLLPHIGSATEQTRAAMADRVFDNLAAFFASGELLSAALLSPG
ncbi:MAG: 2-hydroxyacid dehydrogenase [Leptothrix sp. (in: b-proteobacteria)]